MTHQNEGEHVIPSCVYPPSTNGKLQRLKISACPTCNHSWEADEAHFRNIITAAGPAPNRGRTELWKTIVRSFQPPRGKRDFLDFDAKLTRVDDAAGQDIVFPGKDPRVVRVVRKIVRGLSHHHNSREIIPDERVWTDVMVYETPPAFQSELLSIYHVPDVFLARASFFEGTEYAIDMHSAWLLKFFTDVEFIAIVAAKQHEP